MTLPAHFGEFSGFFEFPTMEIIDRMLVAGIQLDMAAAAQRLRDLQTEKEKYHESSLLPPAESQWSVQET